MSSEEEIPIEEDEDLPEDEIIEEVVRNYPTKVNYGNHPKIQAILENEDVLEVHIRYKRGIGKRIRQPYVCIIYNDGSSIERPLADISENETPICPPRPEPAEEEYYRPQVIRRNGEEGMRGGGRRRRNDCGMRGRRRDETGIVPQRGSRWNFLRMKNRGQRTDIASIVENNENITVKRIVTVVRKGCGCGTNNSSGHRHNNRGLRIPVQYEEIVEEE